MLRRQATIAIVLSMICAAAGSPEPTASQDVAEPVDRVSQVIERMTLRQKVGQIFASRVYALVRTTPRPAHAGPTAATSGPTMRASSSSDIT